MAERVGFEPTVEFPLHTLSKRAPSTTRTSLRLESTTYGRASIRFLAIVISPPMCCDYLRASSIALADASRDRHGEGPVFSMLAFNHRRNVVEAFPEIWRVEGLRSTTFLISLSPGLVGRRQAGLRGRIGDGHLSRRMLQHYSHIRLKAKKTALDVVDEAPKVPAGSNSDRDRRSADRGAHGIP
jgi:hypothetical protein